MATLIPSISTCKFATSGERRFAQRLEEKLEDDYLCWYDVPVGTGSLHPDFIVLHPQRGILILEVKDWRLDSIESFNRFQVKLHTNSGLVTKANPLEQARQYAHALVNTLERDKQLVQAEGKRQGKLSFPWAYGVVLTKVSRAAFEKTDLEQVIPSHRVICQDEMTEAVGAEEFQERLWEMFTVGNWGILTLPQIDRVRWHMFPEIRLPKQEASLFDSATEESVEPPDIVKVMDLQQEQLARSLGGGHRVIHGVAGSGKTMILGYRAEYLAKACARPILVLCFNKLLSQHLQSWMKSKGIEDKVNVHTFHSWCLKQLKTYNIKLPSEGNLKKFYYDVVQKVIENVDRNHIPAGQYDAVLIDEGHDFQPEWLKLISQMVSPQTNSLLLLYDDAQSIYQKQSRRGFSFKSVGIQAQGRTTILRVNYRNTQEILDFAANIADNLLKPEEAEDDNIPRLMPVSGGRHGAKPCLIKLPSLPEEAKYICEQLKLAHRQGIPWNDMAVLYRSAKDRQLMFDALKSSKIPFAGKKKIDFDSDKGKVRFLTYHSSKGLEFPYVAIPSGSTLTSDDADIEELKLIYVAMTRATSSLLLTATG